MIKAILGAVAGLIFGTVGALAYSHYLGDGKLVADLQAQLDSANDKLAKTTQDKQSLSQETSSVSDQIDQLQSTNENLKKQLDDLKNAPAPAAAPALNPLALMGLMRGMMWGGMQGQQRMLLLQSRLHLTPDQATAIKTAMDADNKARRDLMRQMFRNNGKVDPQAAANANTLDQTLANVLTPEQQTAYKQVQADEQASRADTTATLQVDQMMPLLQLNDSQKEQVYNSIYQAQVTAPDPLSLMGNPNAASVVSSQAQATQDAMAKVLTPDQMALYQQEAQAMAQFNGGRRGPNGGGPGGGNGGGPGGGGGGNGNGQNVAGSAGGGTAAPVTTTTATATDSATSATTATTTATDGSAPAVGSSATNAPADATTNAAPTAAATP